MPTWTTLALAFLLSLPAAASRGGGASVCTTDADCASQEDGDLCNGTLYCDEDTNSCVVNPATVVTCATVADTECLKNTCWPTTGECGMSRMGPDTVCDDGDPCTSGDTCQRDGTCGGTSDIGTPECECGATSDCEVLEDGDVCNGTLYCDLTSFTCKLNPATVITCPTVNDTGCERNTCDPLDGTCSMQPMADGHPCEDGNPCTVGDVCYEGTCDAGGFECECGEDLDCYDGDPCNPGYCELATGTCKDYPPVPACPE